MIRKNLTMAGALAASGAVAAVLTALPSASAAPNATPAAATASTKLGTAPYLPLSAAKKVSDLAMQKGIEKGYPVSVTVVDRDGVVINQQRADTATGATVQVSFQKAYAAAGFQTPTADLQNAAKTSPGFTYIPGFSILPGGVPIKVDGKIVGGIGVSGAPTGELDADFANAALKILG
ncbi:MULTISPECIES: heme-binding protein [unclassified Streptomyces]|uniref:GlcG/HbpS family heme-binding protein n=1 Tax=unclassified Streptomyces TaxID=2593676 RepID=UPI00381C8EF4